MRTNHIRASRWNKYLKLTEVIKWQRVLYRSCDGWDIMLRMRRSSLFCFSGYAAIIFEMRWYFNDGRRMYNESVTDRWAVDVDSSPSIRVIKRPMSMVHCGSLTGSELWWRMYVWWFNFMQELGLWKCFYRFKWWVYNMLKTQFALYMFFTQQGIYITRLI